MSDPIGSISSIGSSYASKKQNSVVNKNNSDSDGNITKSGKGSLSSDAKGSASVDNIIALIDGVSDSNITNNELKSAMPSLGISLPKPVDDKALLAEMFSLMDSNHDSVIDSDELKALLANTSKSGLSADEIMTLADTDKDGKISKSEFIATTDAAQEAMFAGSTLLETAQTSDGSDAYNLMLSDLVDSLNGSSTSVSDESASQRTTQLLQDVLSNYKPPVTDNSELIAKGISLMNSGLYA